MFRVVLYRCASKPLAVREGRTFLVYENKVLKKISLAKRNLVGCRRYHTTLNLVTNTAHSILPGGSNEGNCDTCTYTWDVETRNYTEVNGETFGRA